MMIIRRYLKNDSDCSEKSASLTVSPGNINKKTADRKEKAYLSYLECIMDTNAVIKKTKNREVVTNLKGILYITANNASGSKYYDLTARSQSYIAARWQEDVPSYSVIDITKNSFTINTYRTDIDQPIDKQFSIIKK